MKPPVHCSGPPVGGPRIQRAESEQVQLIAHRIPEADIERLLAPARHCSFMVRLRYGQRDERQRPNSRLSVWRSKNAATSNSGT